MYTQNIRPVSLEVEKTNKILKNQSNAHACFQATCKKETEKLLSYETFYKHMPLYLPDCELLIQNLKDRIFFFYEISKNVIVLRFIYTARV